MHNKFVYIPSFATDVSVHTKKRLLEPYKDAVREIEGLLTVGLLNEETGFLVNREFLEKIESLLENVIIREV